MMKQPAGNKNVRSIFSYHVNTITEMTRIKRLFHVFQCLSNFDNFAFFLAFLPFIGFCEASLACFYSFGFYRILWFLLAFIGLFGYPGSHTIIKYNKCNWMWFVPKIPDQSKFLSTIWVIFSGCRNRIGDLQIQIDDWFKVRWWFGWSSKWSKFAPTFKQNGTDMNRVHSIYIST